MRELTLEYGRRLFGRDAANYDAARPDYAAGLYDVLRDRCGLKPGTRTFEVGPGTGLATRRLVQLGASPLVAIEPDVHLIETLQANVPSAEIIVSTFETADLADGAFDLGCAATSFHWMNQRPALAKAARHLAPGGWWAMWWNNFGVPDKPDPFHDATGAVLATLRGSASWRAVWKHPFPLQANRRIADMNAVPDFTDAGHDRFDWTLTMTAAEVRALYATYSQIVKLPETEREELLDAIEAVAGDEFGGRVERHMATTLYTARRGKRA